MKALLLVLLLSGCSTFKMIWPVKHDPAGAQALIQVKQTLNETNCHNLEWDDLLKQTNYLVLYTQFREDPQAKNVEQFEQAIRKARIGSTTYCEATLKLNKTRLEIVEKAWRGR